MAKRPPLHLPRNPDANLVDEKLIKRVGRLNAVANAVEQIDLKAIAASYQQETGGSGLEAASVASAALNAALKASLAGAQGLEAVEREIQTTAKRRARDARSEDLLQARSQEDSKAAQAARAEVHASLEARADKAVASKEERLTDDAATRRAIREERMMAASSRRTLSEARKFIGHGKHDSRSTSVPGRGSSSKDVPQVDIDDPMLRRARALLSGASNVIAQLDEQNQMLLRKSTASHDRPTNSAPVSQQSSRNLRASAQSHPKSLSRPSPAASTGAPPRLGATHAAHVNAQEAALLARANELLADYKPAELQRKAPVPKAAQSRSGPVSPARAGHTTGGRDAGIDADGAAKLAKARQLAAAVDVLVNK